MAKWWPPLLQDSGIQIVYSSTIYGRVFILFYIIVTRFVNYSRGVVGWHLRGIWQFPVPPTIRVFLFLLLRNKLLTGEVMLRRNFNSTGACALCNSGNLESAYHLFFQCPYALRIWEGIQGHLGMGIVIQADSVELTWSHSAAAYASRPAMRCRWQIFFSIGCWAIWQQRNSKIFENKIMRDDLLIGWIISEATLWETSNTIRRRRTSNNAVQLSES